MICKDCMDPTTPARSITEQVRYTIKIILEELLVTDKLTQRLMSLYPMGMATWLVVLLIAESAFTRSSKDTNSRRFQPAPSISKKHLGLSPRLERFKEESKEAKTI